MRGYEAGLDRGVFQPPAGIAEPWSGLISVTEVVEDATSESRYIDGVKIQNRRRTGYFSGNIKAVSYPNSFYENVITQKRIRGFDMSYRVLSNDDTYKIHLVYNVLISPEDFSHKQNENDLINLDFTTLPILVPGVKSSSHLIIETRKAYSWTVAALEEVLYGTDDLAARIPTPEEVFQIFEDNSILQIIDHGDGTWTAIGPDDVITMLNPTTFQIDWPSAVYISSDTYKISSL